MKTAKVAVAFILLFAVAACRKSNDKKANCRIATIIQTSSTATVVQHVTYNNDGRISTITASGTNGFNKVFTYNGNTMIVNTALPDGKFSSRDSITLDAKRKPLNIRQFFSEDLQNWINSRFTYDGDILQKIETSSNGNNSTDTQLVTIVNGNITSLQTAGGTSTLEYFTDKKVQPGDFIELSSLIQFGVNIYPHKNLVKTVANGATILNLNYDFNADGTISTLVATTGATIITIAYQYQCN